MPGLLRLAGLIAAALLLLFVFAAPVTIAPAHAQVPADVCGYTQDGQVFGCTGENYTGMNGAHMCNAAGLTWGVPGNIICPPADGSNPVTGGGGGAAAAAPPAPRRQATRPSPAPRQQADAPTQLQTCNTTGQKIFVAVYYHDDNAGWTSHGWGALENGGCTIMGASSNMNIAVFAQNDGDTQEWSGDSTQCVAEPEGFTIRNSQLANNKCPGPTRNFIKDTMVPTNGVYAYTFTGAGTPVQTAQQQQPQQTAEGDGLYHVLGCNRSASEINVAAYYRDGPTRWHSKGWWNVQPNECKELFTTANGYVYLYADNDDDSLIWSGDHDHCEQHDQFDIYDDQLVNNTCPGDAKKFVEVEITTPRGANFQYGFNPR